MSDLFSPFRDAEQLPGPPAADVRRRGESIRRRRQTLQAGGAAALVAVVALGHLGDGHPVQPGGHGIHPEGRRGDDHAVLAAVVHRGGRFDEAVMIELARATRADVIVHGTITTYSPYPRPRMVRMRSAPSLRRR